MKTLMSNRRLAGELIKQGLIPDHCRLLELSIGATGATVIRYERFVDAGELAKVADALRAAADDLAADDERNRVALAKDGQA